MILNMYIQFISLSKRDSNMQNIIFTSDVHFIDHLGEAKEMTKTIQSSKNKATRINVTGVTAFRWSAIPGVWEIRFHGNSEFVVQLQPLGFGLNQD